MADYQYLLGNEAARSDHNRIPRRPLRSQSDETQSRYGAATSVKENGKIQLQPLSIERSRSASPVQEQPSWGDPQHHRIPRHGRRRYRLTQSVGKLGLVTLVGGTCMILLSCGFLIFLWIGAQSARSQQGRPSAFWTDLIHRGWAPTVVTICSAILRTGITLQTGLLVAGLAAVVLETKGAHFPDVAVLSMSRAWKSSPWDIAPAVLRRSTATGPKGLMYSAVIILSVVIVLASTFISTILLSDFESRQVAGPALIEDQRITLAYEKSKDVFDLAQIKVGSSSWRAGPAANWRFGEYRNDQPENGDTGNVYVAFLPYSDVPSRTSLEYYAGPAMVANTRTICTALPAESIKVALDEEITSNGKIKVMAEGRSQPWTCELVVSIDTFEDVIFESMNDWPISICPQGRNDTEALSESAPIRKKLEAKDPKMPAYDEYNDGTDRWNSFLLLNTTQIGLGAVMREAEKNNSTEENPWEDLTLKKSGELWSDVHDANDDLLFRASLCWYATQPPEPFQVIMSGNSVVREPSWERVGDNLGIQNQLGVGVALDDLEKRGILELDIGDHISRSLNLTDVTDLNEWYNMGLVHILQERPRESDVAWSLARWTEMCTHISHSSIFQSIIKKTKDPAIAVQSLMFLLHRMHYYEIMDMFKLESEATTVRSAENLIPSRWTGLTIVLVMSVVHLVLFFLTTTLFALKTEVSALGNSWQTVAQISGAANKVPKAHGALDKEVEAWAKATGQDRGIWTLERDASAGTEGRVNCLSEIMFQEALVNAEDLDEEYQQTGVPRGPLYGLPISLKDCFRVEGTDATTGYTSLANFPTAKGEESEITTIMRNSGAILFCKTNVPVGMMSGDTFNAMYGYTTNPFDRNLSSGGSSGGEGALLALRGSPLGVGTDLGGSIRIPASFCGLYSLKPSYGRFPVYGIQDGIPGQETLRNNVGPMATSLSAIRLWSEAVLKKPQKLCIGLMLDDGIVRPHPAITRALKETRKALVMAGHEVIDFHIDDPLYLESSKMDMYRLAAAEVAKQRLSQTDEPWPEGYEGLARMTCRDAGPVKAHAPGSELLRLWKAQTKRTELARRMLQTWRKTQSLSTTGREMDALLTPCTPSPACPQHGFTYDNYTCLWNLLDYCATTIPVTTVEDADLEVVEVESRNSIEEMAWTKSRCEGQKGLPVSIQLVGRRLDEENLLCITQACDDALVEMRERTADSPI
ncbi:amidase domain-containing protein [Sarocladium implicatum]|nr:amidase domain-containing protein [Sarocladium implicatum]